MFESQIQECDETILTFKRLKRKYESARRIAIAERKAKVRKLIQHHYKYEMADVCQSLIERGIIDERLNVL